MTKRTQCSLFADKGQAKPAPIISSLWGKMATRPVSLPMILHKCHDYYEFAEDVQKLFDRISPWEELNEPLAPEVRDWVLRMAAQANELIRSLKGVGKTLVIMGKQSESELSSSSFLAAKDAKRELTRLSNTIKSELSLRMFQYIPAPDDTFMRKEKPFGEQVWRAFPSARVELTNSGTAYAVELYTGCVFHLMRATEIALRALCNDRRVTTIRGGPVEMAQWGDILTELDKVSVEIGNWPKSLGEIKTQAQEFYNGAASSFRGIKDEWRNHVAHTRIDYSQSRAEDAIRNVRGLFKTLATHISETTTTPKIWTKAELR